MCTLILLHAATDLFLALGGLPVPLIAAVEDVILLVYAFFLLRGMRQEEPQDSANTPPVGGGESEPRGGI